jgi:hypothetical protein
MQYLILAAIVGAGVVVAVDSVRQRRLRRQALDIGALLAAASASPPTVAASPMTLAAHAIERGEPSEVGEVDGVWAVLHEAVDPERFVPMLADGTEIKTFEMRWGNDYAIVARPDHALHFELQPWEAELMRQMDGTRTSEELIVDHLQAAGDLDPGAVLGLIDQLRESGFLAPARPHVRSLVTDHLDRASHGRRKLREFA